MEWLIKKYSSINKFFYASFAWKDLERGSRKERKWREVGFFILFGYHRSRGKEKINMVDPTKN